MDEHKETYYSLPEVMQLLRGFLAYLSKRIVFLLLFLIVGASGGYAYYLMQKPRYEAATTFILEEKSGGGGGLAGLASQFGVNVGSLTGGGSIFAGDNILDILKSKKVVCQVLLSPYAATATADTTLADHYLTFNGLRKAWNKRPELSNIKFNVNADQLSPLQDSVLHIIHDRIIKKELSTDRLAKQGTIIKVQMASADAHFARLMSERIVAEASRLYLEIRTGTAQANIRQMQQRSDSLLMLLNRKSYTAAASQPIDINPGLRTAIVPVEIANRDKTVLATLYAEVTKNLEASKLMLSQQTPIIQLLDEPGMLLNDNKKGLMFLVVVGITLALFAFVLGAFVIFFVARLKGK